MSESEFGSGLVVCLAKFSEHLGGKEREALELNLLRQGVRARGDLDPQTEAGLAFQERWWRDYPQYRVADTPLEAAISHAIEMWAMGAGDHFIDLDEERAPEQLKQLCALMLELRFMHLDTERTVFTVATLTRVRELWREACLALDRQLGTKPDWGEW